MTAKIEKQNMGFLGAEYQYRLVSAFIDDSKFFRDIYSVIEQNAFTEPCLRSIVGIMKDYYDKHEVVPSYDMILIKLNEKVIHNDEDRQYYEETINKLRRTSCEGRDEIEDLGMEFFKQQEIIRCANEMVHAVVAGAKMDEISVYERELSGIFSIKRHDDNMSSPFESVEEDLSSENTVFIPTGISKLDDVLGGGIEKGKFGLIIGPTGFGKTSMTTSMAAHAATFRCKANNFEGFKVLQIVFEDTHRDIHRKYISRVSQVETADLNRDEETTEKVRNILKNSEDRDAINENIRIIRLESGEESVTSIKNLIKKIINEGFKPDLVIIDYFECIAPEAGTSKMDVTDRESRTMRKLENMAPELDVALWVPTQGNRESLISELVTTNQMGGSIKKGQIATIILSISKTPEQKRKNRATISLLKQRSGRDTITLEGVYFNNGTCTIDCSEVEEFEDSLAYNDYASEKEKEIQQEMIRSARKTFKMN